MVYNGITIDFCIVVSLWYGYRLKIHLEIVQYKHNVGCVSSSLLIIPTVKAFCGKNPDKNTNSLKSRAVCIFYQVTDD